MCCGPVADPLRTARELVNDQTPRHAYDHGVRDRDTINSELRLIAAVRRVAAKHGGAPSIAPVDELLEERYLLTFPSSGGDG
jgi:hypothetical protein